MSTQDTVIGDSSAYYKRGCTPITASRVDQRLHYCLYVPSATPSGSDRHPLIAIVHGTGRTGPEYRDAFAEFAESHGAVVIAPIFPAGINDPTDLHNFKFIEYNGIRFDEVLLAMVAEVAESVPIETEKFYLQGFSGGGQFTHRFLYLHPERLHAVSIGAPGRITELDDSLPWWLGTAGFESRFGKSISFDAMRRVQVHMVVGGEDVETWEVNNPGESNWMDGAERTGETRIERLQTLETNFKKHGISVQFDVVPGIAHDGMGALPAVKNFLAKQILARSLRA